MTNLADDLAPAARPGGNDTLNIHGNASLTPLRLAAHANGRMLARLVTTDNISSEVCADSAYRSQKNEKWLASKKLVSHIHRRKPAGKPMPRNISRSNAAKSSIRAHV